MKILFLDIDGVLFTYGNYAFSPAACKNLNDLLDQEPDLKIVISSSWRHLGMDQVCRTLGYHGIDVDRIIGATGNEPGERGGQVRAWLDRNPDVTNFVVIDDESDFSNMFDHLVQPNGYVGLTSSDVLKCLDILKLPC